MPETPAPTAPAETPTTPTSTPPTGDSGPVDEVARYKALARKHEDDAKAATKRLQALEDRDKTELERATAGLTAAETRAAAAETRALRVEVAEDLGIKAAHRKYLTGTTEDELRARAAEIVADFPAEYGAGGSSPTPPPPTGGRVVLSTRPTESLRPGSVGGAEPPLDPNDWLRARLRPGRSS